MSADPPYWKDLEETVMGSVMYFEDVKVGDKMPALVKEPITEVQLVKYAGASGDFNPLHTVQSVGEAAGFGGVIAHGLLVMGFVAQAVAQWVPNRNMRKLNVRFTGVTRPKDVITVTGEVIEKVEEEGLVRWRIAANNQEGEVKIKGSFEAKLPTKQ